MGCARRCLTSSAHSKATSQLAWPKFAGRSKQPPPPISPWNRTVLSKPRLLFLCKGNSSAGSSSILLSKRRPRCSDGRCGRHRRGVAAATLALRLSCWRRMVCSTTASTRATIRRWCLRSNSQSQRLPRMGDDDCTVQPRASSSALTVTPRQQVQMWHRRARVPRQMWQWTAVRRVSVQTW